MSFQNSSLTNPSAYATLVLKEAQQHAPTIQLPISNFQPPLLPPTGGLFFIRIIISYRQITAASHFVTSLQEVRPPRLAPVATPRRTSGVGAGRGGRPCSAY